MAGIIGYREVFSLAFVPILCSFPFAFFSKGLRQRRSTTSSETDFSVKEVISSLGRWSPAVIYINSFSRMFIMQEVKSTILPPYLNHQLAMNVELIGVIMSLRTAGLIIATVSSSHFSDKRERKPTIILGLAVEGVSFYLHSLLASFELLVLVGFLEGFGGASYSLL